MTQFPESPRIARILIPNWCNIRRGLRILFSGGTRLSMNKGFHLFDSVYTVNLQVNYQLIEDILCTVHALCQYQS